MSSWIHLACECCEANCTVLSECGAQWTVTIAGVTNGGVGPCAAAGCSGFPTPSGAKQTPLFAPSGTYVTDQFAEGGGVCSWGRDVASGYFGLASCFCFPSATPNGVESIARIGITVDTVGAPSGSVRVSYGAQAVEQRDVYDATASCGGSIQCSAIVGNEVGGPFSFNATPQIVTIADICAGVPIVFTNSLTPAAGRFHSGTATIVYG